MPTAIQQAVPDSGAKMTNAPEWVIIPVCSSIQPFHFTYPLPKLIFMRFHSSQTL